MHNFLLSQDHALLYLPGMYFSESVAKMGQYLRIFVCSSHLIVVEYFFLTVRTPSSSLCWGTAVGKGVGGLSSIYGGVLHLK